MAQKIYITTSGTEKIWSERPDGTFQSSKSRLILSRTDIQKSIGSGHMKEVPDGESLQRLCHPELVEGKPTKKPISQSNLF